MHFSLNVFLKHKEPRLQLTAGSEKEFCNAVVRERKRCERSRRPMLLIFLDISKLLKKSHPQKALFDNLSRAIGKSTRDTDITGWYKTNKVIGIIYTEIKETAVSSIRSKVLDNCLLHLGKENFGLITSQFITFPKINSGSKDINIYDILYKNNVPKSPVKPISVAGKRALDICGALAGITAFLPFFIVIPLLIKLTSKGPVIYKQKRIGRGGKIFSFYKFRSMRLGSDSTVHQEYVKTLIKNGDCDTGTTKKLTDDKRITWIGAKIRKRSLDELPQFFNVLKGDMSLVGPRPAIPYEVENYDSWHKRRLYEIKPGLTGIWQVKGRSRATFNEMVRMDISYITNWSLFQDLMLIIRTPKVMITTRGAF